MASTQRPNPAAWLATAADHPEECRHTWARDGAAVTLLPAGRVWDALIVSGRLGHVALSVLLTCAPASGPVLADDHGNTGYLVPPGTATRWLGTSVRCAGRGSWIVTPAPTRTRGPIRWLIPPDGRGTLIDPALLELALHEAVARMHETAP